MAARTYEDLIVWRKADQVASAVFELTASFPADQHSVLVPQMQRAALSIPANIVEGFARRTPRDKARFYTFAEGSADELRYFLTFAANQGYCPSGPALALLREVRKMLRRLTELTLGQA